MTRYLPNILTLLRLLLVAPIAYFLLNDLLLYGVVCFAIAALTDLFDGLIARRVGISRFGSILDPVADKILLLTTFLCLLHMDKISWVVVAAVLLRDLLIVVGVAWYYFLVGPYRLQPTLLGKWNTAMQLILLSRCLLWLLLPVTWLAELVAWLSLVVICLVVASAVDYIIKARARQWLPIK